MLRQLHDDLWVIDLPFKMPGGIELGTRTTVIRLANGSLFAHSPGLVDEGDVQEISKLGQVTHIVAPNLFHHFFVKDWLERYDGAHFYAPPTFEQKLAGVSFETLTDAAPTAWAQEMDQIAIQGAPRMNEIVFCHRPSRSLLLTDICFNLQSSPSMLTRTFFRAMGAYERFGPSRLARLFMKDKTAVKRSIERILELDFDRVIVSHGEVLETGGRSAMREAFAAVG
jgi:hypothetical protein